MNGKPKFIRVRGRVIPIREGSGSRGGRIKQAGNPYQKIGKSLLKASSVAGFLGLGAFAVNKIGNQGLSNANNAMKKVLNVEAFLRSQGQGNNPVIKKAFKTIYSFGEKSLKASYYSGKVLPNLFKASLGLGLASIPFQIIGNKKAHKDGQAVSSYLRAKKRRESTGV